MGDDEIFKIFWPVWLMPFVLIGESIYEEIFGSPPQFVIILVLITAMIMLGRPMSYYMAKKLTLEQVALNGLLIPFIIWVVVVIIKIMIFRLVA